MNNFEKYAVICEGIEIISNTILRCQFIEGLQIMSSNSAPDRLRVCLRALYKSVLFYLAKAKKYYSEGTKSR